MKILFGIVVFLGIVSGGFLIYMKMKTPVSAPAQKNVSTATSQQNAANQTKTVQADSVAQQNPKTQAAPNASATAKTASQILALDDQAKIDWQACGNKTMPAGKTLFWKVLISEAIPQGGTYAKATLLGLKDFPLHITIKAENQDAVRIKERLTVGKETVLRGTCIGTVADGSVSFEAY